MRPILALLLAHALVATAAPAQSLDSAALAAFPWRAIGPAIMGGRVTDVEAVPGNPKIFYVATATGGIWKTINGGTTFHPSFDAERVVSLGDIAIAPSNPDVLYAGTGEEDARNSISPGGGVYKSTDAGKTWTLVGLEKSQHVGRIVVHPTDPNTVYVAALGAVWARNPERGLYKTTDGGKTWTLSKFVSDRAGFVEVAMDPSDPNTLYAASWEVRRGPWFLQSGGPGSALWKTTDAGRSWTEVRGGGFPTTMKGRIGLAIAPSDPKVIYANVEADTLPKPLAKGQQPDTTKRQKIQSGIYRSADGGRTWTQTFNNGYQLEQRPFYYSQVRVDPKNPDRIYWMSSVFRFSDDGGKTVRRGALSIHTDWHAMWIDPNDPDHFIIGDDGGIAITHDRGGTYEFPNIMPLGQFYAVSFDMSKPYRVCGGLQDNGSWCGPSRTPARGGIANEDWVNVGGGDGFYTAIDPTDPAVIYSESQGGNISRLDFGSGARTIVMRGGGRERGSQFEDSLIVARGDTTQPETPTVARTLADIRARALADSAKQYRFNWSTPFFISPHSPTTLYIGGNRLLKSVDRGGHVFPISPDLSTKDSARISVSRKTTGGITRDATGAETYGTITTVAESPIRPGLLWAGTDDGNVWLTRTDGATWENLTGRFPGVPARSYVSRVEASHFDSATVYVTFDNHRENDFTPYAFVSTDFGRTFRRITSGLPTDRPAFVHVIREDPQNRDLLFLGTDVGAYVSTDRGATWRRFMQGLPTVPVHDLQIHPREREIVAGTHGRSIHIADIAALEEMAGARGDSVLRKPAHLFAIRTAYQYEQPFRQMWEGNKVYAAPNPPYGATIEYRLAKGNAPTDTTTTTTATDVTQGDGAARERAAPVDSARIVITGVAGDTVRVLRGPANAGLNRVSWDLRRSAKPLGPKALRDSVIAARIKKQKDDSTKAAAAAGPKDSATAAAKGAAAKRAAEAEQRRLRPAEAPLGAPEDFGSIYRQQRRGPNVAPGDYLVTVVAGGQTVRGVVRVERVSELSPDEPGADDDDEEDR